MRTKTPHRNPVSLPACIHVFFLVLILASFAACAATAGFESDCRALSATQHRLTGTAEYRKAARYVENRLREIGVDSLIIQEFPTVQARVKRCEIRLGSDSNQARPLLPMRANGIMQPVSPKSGISGELLLAGRGRPQDYGTRRVHGKIVVLDYNAGSSWLGAFRLGAKAVVFTGADVMEAWQPHYAETNANLPRFFYPGPAGDLVEGIPALIHSEVAWEGAIGRNILGFIRGTAPVFHIDKEEVTLFAANLDSYGEVPLLSPGARGAANCAALLKLASHFRKHRPKRHVVLAFFDAQSRGHAGVSALYRALATESKPMRLKARAESIEKEDAYIGDIRDLLSKSDPLSPENKASSSVKRGLIERLKQKAGEKKFAVDEQLQIVRSELLDISNSDPKFALVETQIRELDAEKKAWNNLRRELARQEYTAGSREKLHAVISEVRNDIDGRRGELEFERHVLDCDSAVSRLLGQRWIVLHASLMLGDFAPSWGLVVGGDSFLRSLKDTPGLYGRIQAAFLAGYESMAARGSAPAHFLKTTIDGNMDRTDLLLGVPYFTHSGEIAGNAGIYNLVVGTSQEPMAREGTPHDVLSFLNLDRIESQADEAAGLFWTTLNQERLSLLRSVVADQEYFGPLFVGNSPDGPKVMATTIGSTFPNKPMANAIVNLFVTDAHRGYLKRRRVPNTYQPTKIYAFDDCQILRTNQNGSYYFGPGSNWVNYAGFSAIFDERGEVVYASNQNTRVASTASWRQNTNLIHHGYTVLLPQVEAADPADFCIYDARTNSELNKERSSYLAQDGIASWFSEKKISGVKFFGRTDPTFVCLVNGTDTLAEEFDKTANPYGVGLAYEGNWNPPGTGRRGGTDLWKLNETRVALLRARSCINSSIEELHSRGQDLMTLAQKAISDPLSEALAFSSTLIEKTVYRKTRSTMDDLVKAVLVLLALSVPFAFALERLLIGSTIVYKQIAWFVGLFILTFLVLYTTHPAFRISATPMVIFLGFAIILMATMVISIIMRKFEHELKALQGMNLGVHSADVSRFSTIMAAMSMGISTMRRRPLRTALTAVTIVLLTFTILSFASFGALTGIVRIYLSPPPAYTAAFMHNLEWTDLDRGLLSTCQLRWGQESDVAARFWVAPVHEESKGLLVTRSDGAKPVILRGLLGISDLELVRRRDIAELLGSPQSLAGSIWLSKSVAGRIGVGEGDMVLLCGRMLRVGALIDPTQALEVKDMDRSDIFPVNFVEMQASQGSQSKTSEDAAFNRNVRAVQEKRNWTNLSSEAVAIVSAETAIDLGASLYAISIYTADARKAIEVAEDLARMVTPIPVNATRNDGVFVHVLGPVLQASGLKDLIFPILLGGLVIFGTMLGSVSDREKEIYSFSALGLAPPHVAGLFFAESLVYSVVGGLGGYLLANGVVKILGMLSEYGLVSVPEMNYSSSNAVVTILIVMGTVLVSTIYPALKASRSANPGIMRSWRLPVPDGDIYDIVFPFTVSGYDITGVVSFLKEHFNNFSDTGLGIFMAEKTQIARLDGGSLGLNSKLALAPFDLGVTQTFELRSTPSEIPGIDEVKIRIVRVSGQPKDWQRLNRVLLDELRKQFLIWRSISHDSMEMYRSRTLTELGDASAQA